MENTKDDKFKITEMFMAMADKNRCFTGIIKRWKDIDGSTVVFIRIFIPDGLLCAQAPEQKQLGKNLDEIAIMILDMGLHSHSGVTTKIFEADFFLN
jgi:hypothetical protein